MNAIRPSTLRLLSPTVAFMLVSFSLGELGDGLNIFQGIYLVGIGWKEGAVGTALSLMGLTALIVQTWAGDLVDKTTLDRRYFLTMASVATAVSASMILFVSEDNLHHGLIFLSKVVEGVASSFIAPCLAALTLATFGPRHFDAVMATNILWGHIGSVVAAVLAGAVAFFMYPDIKYCFLVIGFSALVAVLFVQYLPEGDPQMGRGFKGKVALDEFGHVENLDSPSKDSVVDVVKGDRDGKAEEAPTPATYWEVFSDRRSYILCITGFFFHFANANVLLVLGEVMGSGDDEDGPSQKAIPLIAGAIVLSQATMAVATWAGDRATHLGVGRRPLFLIGLLSLPIRCALIIHWKDSGDAFLLSTQFLDGIGGGFIGLIHPYLVADITFGTGRFNVLMGLTASMFGLGATLSNFLGQHIVENFGHVASLTGSLILSIIPLLVFGSCMPETYGARDSQQQQTQDHGLQQEVANNQYVEMPER